MSGLMIADGSSAPELLDAAMNPHKRRPFLGNDGRVYTNVFNARTKKYEARPHYVPIENANMTMRRDAWKFIDETVQRVAKPRLKAVGDLTAAGLTLSLPNAYSKTTYEYERSGDITPAIISMDGVRQSDADRPEYDQKQIPLPIIHKDFFFTERQIEISRNSNTPLPSEMMSMASRRVAEEAEKLLIGTRAPYKYAGNSIYGYRTFPERLIGDITHPEASIWTPALMISELLAMRQLAKNENHHGPFFCYVSPGWDEYLDADYSTQKGDNTLRQRIGNIDGLSTPMTLDYLPDFEVILVEKDTQVVQIINGIGITTVQWETMGGSLVHYKVLAMIIPLLKADQWDQTGIVHAVAVEDSSAA